MTAPATPCVGKARTMFEPSNAYRAAKRVCASCPLELRDACLFRALDFEQDAPRRWGVFGGVTPADRARISRALGSAELARRLLSAESALKRALAVGCFSPPPVQYRYRECRGCRELICQPRAGRPQEWCTPACMQRHSTDRAAAARKAKDRWRSLPESERERRRAQMRERWASLSAVERAELARRRRDQRAAKRRAAA